jgi:hypothetical protein
VWIVVDVAVLNTVQRSLKAKLKKIVGDINVKKKSGDKTYSFTRPKI